MKYLKHLILIIPIYLSANCFHNMKVDGTRQDEKPKAVILLGHVENRDIRYMPHTSENLKDMLKFEFIKAGFETDKIDLEEMAGDLYKEDNSLPDKVGNLPLKFKASAGENFYPNRPQVSKNLNTKQIIRLGDIAKFNYFIQGSIAMHNNGKFLDSIDSNLFFLNIYNNQGKQVGMISFIIEERNLYEAGLLKNLCIQVVKIFQEKFKN